jgi:hypothetical protein
VKSLSSGFTAQKNLFVGSELRTLVEIVTSGGTLYYSDQDLVVGSQAYAAKVLEYGRIQTEVTPGEDYIRLGSVPIKLANNPSVAGTILPGDNVTIYYIYDGQGASDKLKIFEGIVTEDIEWDYYSFSFSVKDIGDFYDKVIGEKLTPAAYPNADPDDWNKIKPIIYGPFTNHPCLWIDAGAATTLNADHSDSVTTLNVTDTTRFPSSGSVWIGDEKISYTGKTSVTFTGCTRGTGGTTATTHNFGDAVLEAAASVKALVADHILKAVDKVMILPWGMKTTDAVTIDPADYTVTLDDSGVATITLTDLPNIRKKVATVVSQQPGVNQQPVHALDNDPTHSHTGSSVDTDVLLDTWVLVSESGSYSWSNKTNIYNGVLDDNAEYTNTAAFPSHGLYEFDLKRSFTFQESGSTVKLKAKLNWEADSSLGSGYVAMKFYIDGTLKETINLTGTSGQEATSFYSCSGFSSIYNSTTKIKIDINDIGYPNKVRFLEAWFTVQYTPSSGNKTLPTGLDTNTAIAGTSGTEVQLGGDSVADTLGGTLICNGEGYKDDGSGHYTGVASALVEEPWDVIHHVLETCSNGPVAHADIDLAGSFADADTNLPASYKFAFTITRQVRLNELLTLLAKQTWCRFVWEAGMAKLNRIKTSGSSDKSLNTDDDSLLVNDQLAVKIEQWGLDRIYSDVTVLYNIDHTLSSGDWGNPDAYLANSNDSDAASISAYGRRQRTFHCFAIGDNSTMADDLRAKLLAFYKDARQVFSFSSLMRNVELERGDLAEITCSQLGLSADLAEIIAVNYDLPIPIQERGPMVWFTMLAG